MIRTEIAKTQDGAKDLIRTYSDENWRLKQVETDIKYGSSVIDVIAGYDKDGKPYSRYTYMETDEKDEPPAPEEEATAEDYEAALERLGVE